ncbi:MAG TPA: chromosomal replication initiator protein DnaA [bacterium]|nr:chromosomal replication initiator protein DnaA [bacterium]
MTTSADLWDRCLENLKKDLNRQSFETWFKPTKGTVSEEKTLKVIVPNEFFRDWIRDHYQPQIRKALETLHPVQLEIQFEIEPTSPSKTLAEPVAPSAQLEIIEKPRLSMPTGSRPAGDSEFVLNNKFNFESFVVGNSNRFAHAACLAVAESPARSYNPLFIYGGVGLGKTHLLQAIGNFVVEQNPQIRVLYISSEKFMNDFIQAIQSGRQQDFRNKYRTVDVLLIDDIQFWEGKEATQEEFFHTFNVLYEAQKQIVATSDSHPKEIKLEERLKNRFEMGLITDIQEPDLETRIAILRKKAETEGILVPNEVTAFIANHAKANIRELEGSLLRVIAFGSLTRQEISIDLAREVLKDSLPKDERPISVDSIQRVVADRYHCKYSDMKSKKRTKQIAFPRQIAMFLSRELTHHSLSEIGAAFGGKDHTTIIHAYEKIEDLLTTDITLLAEVNSLKKQLLEGNYSL